MLGHLAKFFAVAFAISVASVGVCHAQNNITILRGVSANVNNGNASVAPGQFAFTGNPPTLSLFDTTANAHAANVIQPCYLHVVVSMPNNPPVAGDVGTITANGNPYVVTFDNNPVGHWSIALGGQNQQQGRTDFNAYAVANRNFTNGFGLANGVNCH